MKKLLTASVIFFSVSGFAAERFALLIGNNEYKEDQYGQKFSRLTNPIEDAETIAAALEKVGFSVTVARNLSHATFNEAIQNFSRRLNHGDIAFVYFAGHGIAIPSDFGGNDYLIPIGANIDTLKNVEYEAINAQQMLNSITASGAHTIMVLDACRNNPFTRGSSRGLGFMKNTGSSYILYSASFGQEARDDGTFARALATEILRPQSLESLRAKVARAVSQASGGRQNPISLSQLDTDSGTLYFLKPTQMQSASASSQENQSLNSDPWMKKLWAWADEFNIPEKELPRNKKELLALESLSIDRWDSVGNDNPYKSYPKITYLPPEIGQLSHLQSIVIRENKLQSLPPEIGQLKNLKYLAIPNNKLQSLPPEIRQLKNLEMLYLQYNQIRFLPPEIGQLSSLREVDFSSNQLQSLPYEMGKLKKLESIYISSNQLQFLPSSLSQLESLNWLVLSGNPNLKLTAEQKRFINEIK